MKIKKEHPDDTEDDQMVLGLIKRRECDPTSWNIIEQTFQMTRDKGSERVEAHYLFLAMLNREECLLANALKKKGMAVDKIKKIFDKVISKGRKPSNKGIQEISFSKNVEEILIKAKELASNEDRRISEKDLTRAFLRLVEGETKKHINGLGIDLSSLDIEYL